MTLSGKPERAPERTPERAPVREIVVDERIGELRAALIDRGRVVDLRVERWSDHDTRARWGQVFAGRVTHVEAKLSGAFVDIGTGRPAFCPWQRERPELARVGAGVLVRIVREAEPAGARDAEKGATVVLEGAAPDGAQLPALIGDVPPWHGWPGEPREASPEEAELIDAAVTGVLEPEVAIPGGGRLTIEATRAMTVIDVDSAGRETGGRDPARFARDLNLAAVPEIVRQLRLRSIGGLICVDFTGPRRRGDPEALTKALASAFDAERNGGVAAPKTDILPVSRFGICEIARQKRRPALSVRLTGPDGKASAETLALDGLARLARVLATAKGQTGVLRAPPAVLAWLEADSIGWRDELATAVGGRHVLEAAADGATACEVFTR
jgi:ribonuclease G